jgi:predicted PurR-regulated permease PerM
MTNDVIARRSLFVLLVGAMVLLGMIIAPLAIALFLSMVLAAVLWPVWVRLARLLGGRPRLAAGLLVTATVLIVIGPLLGLSVFVVTEVSAGIDFVSDTIRSEGVSGLIEKLPDPLPALARGTIEQLPAKSSHNLEQTVAQQVRAQGGKAAAVMGAALSATGSFLFQSVMMLIAFFFFLVRGEDAVAWLDATSPLREGQTRELLREFKKVSYAVIVSSVLTAGIQAVAAVIGYYIAQVPHPIFFGTTTFIIAFIPAVGAGSVVLSAAAVMYVTGHNYAAIFLVIWALTVVGLVDNLVKPLLIRGGLAMNGAIVFFALIGGISAFGAVGLLVGPLIVALFLAVLRMTQRSDVPGPMVLTPSGEPRKPLPPDPQ